MIWGMEVEVGCKTSCISVLFLIQRALRRVFVLERSLGGIEILAFDLVF